MIPWMTLIGVASAQDSVVDQMPEEASVSPVLDALGDMVTMLQGKGVQITDISLGRVKDDGVGSTVSLQLMGGVSVVAVGLGDARRIADLDLAVTDHQGGSWSDQMSDNNPVVQLDTSESGGEYTATLVVSEAVEGAPDGFYLLVTGFQTDPSAIIDASGMVEMLKLASGLSEGMDLRFVHGGMVVVPAGQNSTIELTIPTGTHSRCLVMAFGSPERTKKLALNVTDNAGNVLSSGKGKGVVTALIPTTSTSSRYRAVLTPKLGSGYGDGYGMAIAACQ